MNDYADSSHQLEQLLHKKEIQKADQLLLDIIGITANIGAKPLYQIATDLKYALQDTSEQSYMTLLEQYTIHLKNLLNDIKTYK